MTDHLPLVSTIREKCRVCYTCVRECPAKAIRISGGQAEVIAERCIGCGNCVKVCTQKAKKVRSSAAEVRALLGSGARVAACLAPSFPAEIIDLDHRELVGMLRRLGFELVTEVAFGADLVARRYLELLEQDRNRRYIAANCPAIVEFISRYHPELCGSIAPVVSPMIAMARALRALHGSDLRVVFIGPCIAKKSEHVPDLEPEIDSVLTFIELRQMLDEAGIRPDSAAATDFDPPRPGAGMVFPLIRGMLQAAEISEDLMVGDVVAADGRIDFVEAIKEFESGDLNARLLEVLCCTGCIMGPGMSSPLPRFSRRSLVSKYARQCADHLDRAEWRRVMDQLAGLDLSRTYIPADRRINSPSEAELRVILDRLGKRTREDELNCGACGYDTCREHAVAIFRGIAESEMCLPFTIDELRRTVGELAVSNRQLADVQEALVQSEKLASMGQLAAGIAHEINNPLGIVLMYSHLLLDEHGADPGLREDLTMIAEQTDRCKKIVAGLLHFARQNKIVRHPVELPGLVTRTLRAHATPAAVKIEVQNLLTDPTAEVDGDQLAQVIANLVGNAVDAMPEGGLLTISLDGDPESVRLSVADTGPGIPAENLPKIFEPFFTTKPLGRGTGLGLAVSHGIVKKHGGEITVETNSDADAGPTGSVFTVRLPRRGLAE